MGCGTCGTGVSGCGSSGGCGSGCNRMNVFNWLADLPLYDTAKPYPIIEVTFNKGSRKDFFRNNTFHLFEKGESIAVEGIGGFDVGQVSLTGELVKLQMKKYSVTDNSDIKRVLRKATEEDLKQYEIQKAREQEVMIRARAIATQLNLQMKVCEVEIQADGKKATFFYTADQRVDFRELIKLYASDFKVKVEMRQIGARQESGKVGGIGSCGRELCCSTWLSDFKSVNTTAARYQNLSINQTKLSGQCGRLKCCLNYELDTYLDALSVFPDNAEVIQTVKGNATLIKRDIFKNLMWYGYSDSSKQYPLTITRVKEILQQNKQGQKPDELQPVELEVKDDKGRVKVDVGFVNDVGQISLRSLEKNSRKKKQGGQQQKQAQQGGGGRQQQGQPKQAQQQGGQRQQGNQQQRPQQGQQPKQAQQQGGGQQRNNNNQQQRRPNPQQQQGQQPKQAQQQGQGGDRQRQGGNQQQRPNNNNQNRNRDRNQQQKPKQEEKPASE